MRSGHIKPIIMVGMIIGSIFFVKMMPVDITYHDAIKEVHYLKK